MIIKQADDKAQDLEILRDLVAAKATPEASKRTILLEIRKIQAGMRGEKETAYEIEVAYGASRNWAIIHDLRIEHEGFAAQIDHLVINRFLDMWVCESKHFSEGVAINEHGEFTAFFGGKPYGAPSPIEQNAKHILMLERLFNSNAFELPTRLGSKIRPELIGLVLVSRNARIARPKKALKGLECVVKTDQFQKSIDKTTDRHGILSLSRAISSDTLESVAKRLAALHKPIAFDWPVRFGLSNLKPGPAAESPIIEEISPPEVRRAAEASRAQSPEVAKELPSAESGKSKLDCASCGTRVPYNVAKFCWSQKQKFGGNVLCLSCQKTA